MIAAGQAVNLIWMGTALLLLGLVPGLFQALGEALCRVSERAYFRLGIPLRFRDAELHAPRWFAHVGAAMICVALFLYLAR